MLFGSFLYIYVKKCVEIYVKLFKMWKCVLELTHQTWHNVWLKVFYDEGGKENWGSLHWLIGYWIIVEIQTVL